MKNYLSVLEESLVKKIEVLGKIRNATFAQKELLEAENLDLERFDAYVDEKDELIKDLDKLDEGFETLYKRVSSELEANKDQHKAEIARLKELIKQITELSVTIEAQESRNRDSVTTYFSKAKKNITKQRKSSKAAYDCYKAYSKANGDKTTIMDQKQ